MWHDTCGAGSHGWPAARETLPQDSIPAEMKRGSALNTRDARCTGQGTINNQTDHPRVALNVSYNSRNLRQEEDQYVSIPADVARDLPAELQQMLGY